MDGAAVVYKIRVVSRPTARTLLQERFQLGADGVHPQAAGREVTPEHVDEVVVEESLDGVYDVGGASADRFDCAGR